jgi:hypothetical protein
VALIVLGLTMAYAILKWRRRIPQQKRIGDEAAKRNSRSK